MPYITLKDGFRQVKACILLFFLLALSLGLGCEKKEKEAKEASSPRLVSLSPSLTSTVLELGGKSHLVGVSKWCEVKGVPVVGDMNPRLDAILMAKPDLVIMEDYGFQSELRNALLALGLKVKVFPLSSLENMREATLGLGEIMGKDGASLVKAFDQALRSKIPHAPRVLLVFDTEPGFVWTTGGESYVSELLTSLGARNPIKGPKTMRLGLERVLREDPDFILHVAPSPSLPDDDAVLSWWSSFPELSAYKNGRIALMPSAVLAKNSPKLIEGIHALLELLQWDGRDD